MNRSANPISLIHLLSRSTLIVLALAAPVLALPAAQPTPSHIILQPEPVSKGLGFVLTMMLQRR